MWIASKRFEGKKTDRTYKEAVVRVARYIEFVKEQYPAMTDAEMEAMLEGAQFAAEELLGYLYGLDEDYPNRDIWSERRRAEYESAHGLDLQHELGYDEEE